MVFKYSVAGLKVLSEIRVPTLKNSDFMSPDISVFLTENVRSPEAVIEFLNKKEILYRDIHDNKFLITASKIFISPSHNKLEKASISLVGIPLGFSLQKHYFQVLHGSCVAINGNAVCFVGESASGKSSIALSLINKGFKLITEDLCVIKDNEVYSFSSWIKSDQKNLIENLDIKDQLVIDKDSRNREYYKLADHHTNHEKVKLKAIYFLRNEKKREIVKIEPSDSFKYLFTYAYRSHDSDAEGLRKLTKICGSLDCFLFSRSIEEPVFENTEYLFEQLEIFLQPDKK